jgi:hypothetical protein
MDWDHIKTKTKKAWTAKSMPFLCLHEMARVTGLEPATSGVTGRHSNQLSYTRSFHVSLTSRQERP